MKHNKIKLSEREVKFI